MGVAAFKPLRSGLTRIWVKMSSCNLVKGHENGTRCSRPDGPVKLKKLAHIVD